MFAQFVAQIAARMESVAERHERRDRLSLEFVVLAHDRGFSNGRMIDECALDFHGADTMARDVEHVIDTTQNPVVPIGVALDAVTGEIEIRPTSPLREVRIDVPLIVAPDGTQHAGPWMRQREQSATDLHFVAVGVEQCRTHAGKRRRGRPGFRGCHARQWRDHDGARLGLPPCVDDWALFLADDAVIPHPCFRIDRLTDGTQ